ncbi:MAG: hypothetical protein HYZ84_00285 [Candidatus Omnitrophica bacterium]|nr:hypothetical protein [Candidatus Omnitrophota bacterium]
MKLKMHHFFYGLLWFGVLLLLQPSPSRSASESPITVKAEINRAFITIGDPVEYTVTIHHAPSIEILSNVPPPVNDALKIQKIEEIRKKEGKWIVEGRRFHLTSFRLGQFIIDPVEIQYRDKDAGGEVKKLQTNRLFLSVQSVDGAKEKNDIRGIKSVLAMANRGIVVLIAAVLLIAAMLAVIAYRRFASKTKAMVSSEPALSADEQAIIQLNELFDSDLLRRGKIKEYYLRLSEILRTYFEKRYSILASESTTYEVLKDLKEKEIPLTLREKIEAVLSAADLAKFAKWRPEPAEIIHINKQSKEIVEQSRPIFHENSSSESAATPPSN